MLCQMQRPNILHQVTTSDVAEIFNYPSMHNVKSLQQLPERITSQLAHSELHVFHFCSYSGQQLVPNTTTGKND